MDIAPSPATRTKNLLRRFHRTMFMPPGCTWMLAIQWVNDNNGNWIEHSHRREPKGEEHGHDEGACGVRHAGQRYGHGGGHHYRRGFPEDRFVVADVL
ncbi:MAG: hypothetical protein MZU79_08680 [Anaerotruncus sp.]|nr:hypothetical protein [Anaerotruncus sp.]